LADNSKKHDLFGNALFDVEHALGMYATSFCTIPAEGIYDKESLTPLMSVIKTCHIYLIGFVPKIDFVGAKQNSNKLSLIFSILDKEYILESDVPDGLTLNQDGELFYLGNEQGERFWPDESLIQTRLCHDSNAINFEVKYIGQAYGKDGSRNAIDRLLKHETLQKIALKGVPDGYQLTLLLLEVQPNNQLFTMFNPHAKNKDEDSSRIKAGLDKLYGTTEQERIALYEAALIRYFSPSFNKEFKNSFPSTNLKILQDSYEKDFAAVIAEICIDELPFKLYSESIEISNYHIAKHNLHKDEARKIFFGM
jgi:hypothetical protein